MPLLVQCTDLINFNLPVIGSHNYYCYSLFPNAGFRNSCRTQTFFLQNFPVCHKKKITFFHNAITEHLSANLFKAVNIVFLQTSRNDLPGLVGIPRTLAYFSQVST